MQIHATCSKLQASYCEFMSADFTEGTVSCYQELVTDLKLTSKISKQSKTGLSKPWKQNRVQISSKEDINEANRQTKQTWVVAPTWLLQAHSGWKLIHSCTSRTPFPVPLHKKNCLAMSKQHVGLSDLHSRARPHWLQFNQPWRLWRKHLIEYLTELTYQVGWIQGKFSSTSQMHF